MIAQELVEIWHRIIGGLEQYLWYIVDDTEEFLPSLWVAISFNHMQSDTLLLISALIVKMRALYGINTDPLDYLTTTL